MADNVEEGGDLLETEPLELLSKETPRRPRHHAPRQGHLLGVEALNTIRQVDTQSLEVPIDTTEVRKFSSIEDKA